MLLFSKVNLNINSQYFMNSTFTIWRYKFSIYYKCVIVIDLVYAQHVTEEH